MTCLRGGGGGRLISTKIFKTEPYLINQSLYTYQKILAKFHSSAHRLRIETARYNMYAFQNVMLTVGCNPFRPCMPEEVRAYRALLAFVMLFLTVSVVLPSMYGEVQGVLPSQSSQVEFYQSSSSL